MKKEDAPGSSVFKVTTFLLFYLYCYCLMAGSEVIANQQGYVDSVVCAGCHKEQYEGFQHVGMSQSFAAATSKWLNEEKRRALPFYHAPSKRYYNLVSEGETLVFQRYQLDEKKQKVNEVSVQVDYLLGSGNKATSLLFRNKNDELYLLPINWYSEGAFWEMSPGYESKNHYGLSRQIKRECMFCHNAFPETAMEVDEYWQRDTFPEKLKSGIDCQRCHGPGEAHLKQVYSENTSIAAIQKSIINPAKLPAGKRDSVCFQCHLLPVVSMIGMRDFSRTDYSFRPGEDLTSYLLHVDIVDENMAKEDRFEINHQAYRLTQSRCFTETNNQLTCISCHNPHKKPAETEFVQHVANQCIACHKGSMDIEQHDSSKACVSCHMPQRRTQDVINVVMTDHKIGVVSDRNKLLEPLTRHTPIFTDMSLWDREMDMNEMEKDIYKLTTILQSTPSLKYAEYLKSRLQASNYPHERPYVLLAETYLALKNYREAKALLNFIKHKFEANLRVEELIALSLIGLGEDKAAADAFEWLLEVDSENADLHFNFGLLKYQQGAYKAAFDLFEKAYQLKQNFANAVTYMALAKEAKGELETAKHWFIRSLQIEPNNERAYKHLIPLLYQSGDKSEAKRYLELAIVNVDDFDVADIIAEDQNTADLQ